MKKFAPTFLASTLATLATMPTVLANPTELSYQTFADSTIAPSPACLSAAANGDVYVGVDLLGSLGKGPNKGRIVKLIDTDNDGQADKHTVFAKIDNPRGLIAIGDKVYVLHTVIPESTGILEAMHLSVLTDADGDGVADGPAKHLIENISVPLHNQKRGADHTTNGIRMGIDGWIYIAVGDFGFVGAKGTDGTEMTQLGGGILRVRPDGSEMEVYTHGLRNIYDVAIDPFMNIFTRGNTNDGGGWNVRFIHQIQSGQYGYPMLFKHFTDEIIPALEDLGGGSGTGALFMDEPSWPQQYNKVPMMADWGRNQIYIHRVTTDGASFTQKPENFIGINQPSDVDVDGSGRMFIAAWAGAGYKGNPKRGYIQQVTPKGWQYKPFPKLKELSSAELVNGLRSKSATAHLNFQQEILRRGSDKITASAVLEVAKDSSASKESRVAAIFTYAQLTQADGISHLVELSEDAVVKEWALRALADRLPLSAKVPQAPFYAGLKDSNSRVRVASAVALGRLGDPAAVAELIKLATPPVAAQSAPVVKPPLFESEVISGKQSVDIAVDIKGVKKLYLIVDDGKNGNAGDHGAWFDPTLIDAQGNELKLTSRKWKSAKQGWGVTAVNKTCTGAPLKRADGKPFTHGIGTHSQSVIEYHIPKKFVRFQATGALSTTANESGSVTFVVSSTPPAGAAGTVGPHATPNSAIVVPHVAVHALVRLGAVDACLAAVNGPSQDGALWALRLMHDSKGVDGLIEVLNSTDDEQLQLKVLTALARLYQKEAPYDGSWWWKTQPDTRGPYYVPVKWQESEKIEATFRAHFAKQDEDGKNLMAAIATKHRMNLAGIGKVEKKTAKKIQKVGDISIEDVMLAFEKVKGNRQNGRDLLRKQACIGCHSIEDADAKRGPDLNFIGAKLDREAIAEAILKPDATIADNWVDVTMADGMVHQGTLVTKTASEVIVRNIGGIETKLDPAKVKSIAKASSTIMGPHLMDSLTLKEFVDVVDYLQSKKK